ncbi:MAG TPA: MFS transporter [Candidatus Acidoferrales bacterium]|nr:MFS transporter [Candidatus Acidoferrales bacterium]
MLTRNIIVVLSLTFLINLGYGLILPGLSLYAVSLGASRSFVGVIVSIYALAQLIVQIPAGRFSDRLGRKVFLLAGFAGVAVAAALNNFASHPSHFFLFQALAGASAGCLWPTLMALLTEEAAPSARGRLMGIFSTIFFLGLGLGPFFGGQIATRYGFLATFNLWSAIAVLGAIVCASTVKAPPRLGARRRFQRESKPKEAVGLIRPGCWPTFLAGCTVRARGGFCSSFNNSILPLYVAVSYDATPKMIGSLMLVHALGLAFFNIPGGLVTDRFGRKAPAIVGSLVATAGVFWYSFPGAFPTLLAAVGLAGAGSAFSSPALAALTADISNPQRRAEAYGYFLTSFQIGVIFGATIFGFVADLVDLPGAVLAWGITSLALSLCGFLIRERRTWTGDEASAVTTQKIQISREPAR